MAAADLEQDLLEKKLLDLLRDVRKNKFTGCITIQVVYSDGGLRSCKKAIEETLTLKSSGS
jgi:hypothetical protein